MRNLSGAELNPEVCWSLTLQAVWQEGPFCAGTVLCGGLQRSPQGLARPQPSAQWRLYLPFEAHLLLKGEVWGYVRWSIPQRSADACFPPGLDEVGTRPQGFHWALLGFYTLSWPCKASPVKPFMLLSQVSPINQACSDALDLGLLLQSSWFTIWPC